MADRHAATTPTLTETLNFSLKALLCISIAVCGFMGVRSLLHQDSRENWLQSVWHTLHEELCGEAEDDGLEGVIPRATSALSADAGLSSGPQ